MTADGIDELRQYVSGLKQSRSGDTRLADSIRRFASKFENATGIHVKVTDHTEGFVGNDRLTSEMFQMAAEALSNVHRHTQARSARVSLSLEGNVIQLQVENDRNQGADRASNSRRHPFLIGRKRSAEEPRCWWRKGEPFCGWRFRCDRPFG